MVFLEVGRSDSVDPARVRLGQFDTRLRAGGMPRRLNVPKPPELLWLVVEWKAPRDGEEPYGLVTEESLVGRHRLEELYTGKVVEVVEGGETREASIVIVRPDKNFLMAEHKYLNQVSGSMESKAEKVAESPKEKDQIISDDQISVSSNTVESDYESSESDWKPDDDSYTNENGKRKFKDFTTPESNKRQAGPKETPRSKSPLTYSTQTRVKIASQLQKKLSNMESLQKSRTEDTSVEDSTLSNGYFDSSIYERSKRLSQTFQDITRKDIGPKREYPPMTFDQQTQTDCGKFDEKHFSVLMSNQRVLKTEMVHLFKVMDDIKKQMERTDKTVKLLQNLNNQYMEIKNANVNDSGFGVTDNLVICERVTPEPDEVKSVLSQNNTSVKQQNPKKKPVKHLESIVEYETPQFDATAMIPIGSGKTLIPKHVYNQIKWTSYTSATRRLLMSIFPRRTLATHSLTGKSSPAFTNRPAKMQLDPKKISDIVMTVSQMCDVQENLVRNTITTKCSDENKMYRMRLKKMQEKSRGNTNQENECPTEFDE